MRIIAGEFGGRALREPRGRRVRPTTGRVREAWFSILQTTLPGAVVVDLCAGSGALGLEALSRGAARADFVERARAAVAVLRANIRLLGVEDRARVFEADALGFVDRLAGPPYDIAFADPPYASAVATALVDRFREKAFARILGVEHPAALSVRGDDTRTYGDVALTFCYSP